MSARAERVIDLHTAALAVPCPVCRVPAGRSCRGTGGGKGGGHQHMDRRAAAGRKREAGR